jgi:uncharacterized protein YkwD
MRTRHILLLLAVLTGLSLVATTPAAATTTPRTRLLNAINETRAAHDLPRVYWSTRLTDAAQTHTRSMMRMRYFAHTSPGGSTLYTRVLNCGFRTFGEWRAGETLAWGTGTYGTPRATVRMWLNSPSHRAVLLSPAYRWVGIGRAVGAFQGHSGAVVWTADWGQR